MNTETTTTPPPIPPLTRRARRILEEGIAAAHRALARLKLEHTEQTTGLQLFLEVRERRVLNNRALSDADVASEIARLRARAHRDIAGIDADHDRRAGELLGHIQELQQALAARASVQSPAERDRLALAVAVQAVVS